MITQRLSCVKVANKDLVTSQLRVAQIILFLKARQGRRSCIRSMCSERLKVDPAFDKVTLLCSELWASSCRYVTYMSIVNFHHTSHECAVLTALQTDLEQWKTHIRLNLRQNEPGSLAMHASRRNKKYDASHDNARAPY